MFKYVMVAILLALCIRVESFTPSKRFEFLTEIIDLDLDEKPISDTLTHMDILRKGLIRSLTRYFAENQQKFSSNPEKHIVKFEKADTVYYKSINELYKDYLGQEDYAAISECGFAVETAINELADAVANVDFDKNLKDLPWAHFDANTFNDSNRYVKKLIDSVYIDILSRENMVSARQKIGSLLHTIQDFYSHSNWIEMGYSDRINENLGSDEFGQIGNVSLRVVDEKDVACLSERCAKKVLKCNHLNSLSGLVKFFKPIKCPIVYYKCENNVITNKLTTGYFTGQKLNNGDEVNKPSNSSKCSHGGVFDESSFRPAEGGINKDTAFYFLSPRADLHLKAAELAVQHTEYFFTRLRENIGDQVFDDLLLLFHTSQPSVSCFFKRIFSYI